MQRRSLLTSVGLGIAASSAGCVESAVDAVDRSSRIGWISLANYDTKAHLFELQVVRDGSTVHDATYTIRGEDGSTTAYEVIECTWGDTAGRYSIRLRIDDNGWVTRTVDEATDGAVGCVTVRVRYGDLRWESETLDIFIRENCEDVPEYNGGCNFANE